MPFPRWQNSWTSNHYPRARPKRRRGRKRRKLLNYKTLSSHPTDSSPSPQEPNTSLEEMESHRLARYRPHPRMLHLLHVLDLLGFRRRLLRIGMVEVGMGPRFRTGWTVERRWRLDSGRRGKRGTSTRTRPLQSGGSTSIHASCLAPVLSFLCGMDKRTLIVPNTTIDLSD